MLLSVLLVIIGFVPALMLAMSSDGCSTGCSIEVLTAGWYLALIGPPVACVAGLAFTITALVQGKRAARRAWLAVAIQVAVFVLGVVVVFGAAGF